MKKILLTTVLALFAMDASASATQLKIEPSSERDRPRQHSMSHHKLENILQQTILASAESVERTMTQIETAVAASSNINGNTGFGAWNSEISALDATNNNTANFASTTDDGSFTVTVNPTGLFPRVRLGTMTLKFTPQLNESGNAIITWRVDADLQNLENFEDSALIGDNVLGRSFNLTQGLGWPFSPANVTGAYDSDNDASN